MSPDERCGHTWTLFNYQTTSVFKEPAVNDYAVLPNWVDDIRNAQCAEQLIDRYKRFSNEFMLETIAFTIQFNTVRIVMS